MSQRWQDGKRNAPPRVVLDAGHGGGRDRGRSTCAGVRGALGTREEDLTLALAELIDGALGARGVAAAVTRRGDENPTLRERTDVARAGSVDAFVSLHFNASPDPQARGAEVWLHDAAGERSRRLAEALGGMLDGVTLRTGSMAVLDPIAHAPETAACLVEVAYLTNAEDERDFADEAHRERAAEALANGIAGFLEGEHFDIWHQVPMVPQLTGMSCWAAAAAMIVGWRDCLDVRPEEVARGAGAWAEYREGLEPKDVDALGRIFGLVVETPRAYQLPMVRRLLERYGPLWVGAGPTGLHVVVVSGMHGDGTPDGTFMRVLDPWPLGRGERYTITFAELAANLEAATDAAGVRASIMHCGDAARGVWGRSLVRRSAEGRAIGGNAEEPGGQAVSRMAAAERRARYGTPVGLFRLYRDNPPPPWLSADGPGKIGGDRFDGSLAGDERDWYPATEADLDRLPPVPADLASVRTAEDGDNPDLRHLAAAGLNAGFTFTGAHLLRLARLNAFDVSGSAGVVLFGLRGCRCVDASAEGLWSQSAVLDEDVPDYRGLHCVLGLWRPGDGKIAVFNGSTVPSRRWIAAQRAAGAKARVSNLLPTGHYRYRLGDHRFVPGVFVVQPRIVVRRSLDDLIFTVRDRFEEASPADNIHPAFHDGDAMFSSAGCQTVPGWYRADGGHGGGWAQFRAAALRDAGAGAASIPFSYLLLTGREARLVTEGATEADLRRLRFGSSGDSVTALQRALAARGFDEAGAGEPGQLDAPTALAFMRFQADRDLGAADGIVLASDAKDLGFRLR